jgi:hypothetical protein
VTEWDKPILLPMQEQHWKVDVTEREAPWFEVRDALLPPALAPGTKTLGRLVHEILGQLGGEDGGVGIGDQAPDDAPDLLGGGAE